MFSSGEFSRVTGLSIKALRIYHEDGLLTPAIVDTETGYRYYDFNNVEKAKVISLLRQMMFSLDEIKRILGSGNDDSDAISFLESHRAQLESKIRGMKAASASIQRIIESEKAAKVLLDQSGYQIEERTLGPVLIAGLRTKGKYRDCGQAFAKLGRTLGWNIAGKPLNLYFDAEYKENDADFESCFPLKRPRTVNGIEVRELAGGRAVTLLHRGPYDQIGRSYAKVFSYLNERGLVAKLPSREVYLKGPGMIFKGSPARYLTEIQVLVAVS